MSRQTVEFSITAAEKLNETLNAFLQIDREGALQRATEIEQSGHVGPLSGVPIAVKDNHLRQRTASVLRLEDTWPLSSALQRYSYRTSDQGWRGRDRQNKLRRVCDGFVE